MLFNSCVFCFFCAFAFRILAAIAVQHPIHAVQGCSDPIGCLVEDININIPDFQISIAGGNVLYVTAMHCGNVSLTGFPSTYIPPTSLHVEMDGLGLACSAHYSYTIFQGAMNVAIKETTVDISYLLRKGEELPLSMNFTACSIPTIDIGVVFSGGLGTNILNILSSAMEEAIKKAMNAIICVQLAEFIAVNGTYALVHSVDPLLSSLIAVQPSPPVTVPFDSVDWNDSLFGFVYALFGSQLGDSLKMCLETHFPGSSSPYINAFVDALTSTTGTITADLQGKFNLPFSNGNISISSISIGGLDTFQELVFLKPSPSSNVTLQSLVVLQECFITLNISVASNPVGLYEENLQVKLKFSDVKLGLDLAVALNKTALDMLYFDQVLDAECLLESIGYLGLSSLYLDMNVDQLVIVEVSGGAQALERDLVALLDSIFAMLTSPTGYKALLNDVIYGLLQGPVRHAINEKLTALLSGAKQHPSCRPHQVVNRNSTEPIWWFNSSFLNRIDNLVNDKVGPLGLNKLMNCITNGTGVIRISEKSFFVEIGGLNSFFEFSLLQPYSDISMALANPYNLLNTLGIGYCNSSSKFVSSSSSGSSSCNPLRLSLKLYSDIAVTDHSYRIIGDTEKTEEAAEESILLPWLYSLLRSVHAVESRTISSPEMDARLFRAVESYFSSLIVNPLQSVFIPVFGVEDALTTSVEGLLPAGGSLEISLENFSLYVNLLAQLNPTILSDLQVSQKGVTGCIATSFEALVLAELRLAVTNASLVIGDGKKNKDLTSLVSRILEFMSRPDKIASINSKLDDKLSNAPIVCQNGGVFPVITDDNIETSRSFVWQWYLTLLVVGLTVSLGLLLYVYNYYGRWRLTAKEQQVNNADENLEMIDNEHLPSKPFYEYWGFEHALVCQAGIPLWIRISLFIIIMGDMGLFINSNMVDIAQVIASIDIRSEEEGLRTVTLPVLFSFSFKGTIQDLWDAEVYTLAVLLAVFAGPWPFMKLGLMAYCWVAPSRLLSTSSREGLLKFLDMVGKWSLIDFFIMTMMMSAFMVNLTLSPNLTVHANMVPTWGFYAFLLGTTISMGAGHIVIATHRFVVTPTVHSDVAANTAVLDHIFKIQRRLVSGLRSSPEDIDLGAQNNNSASMNARKSRNAQSFSGDYVFVKASKAAKVVCFITFAIALVWLYFGCTLKTFEFDILGLAGLLLKEDAYVEYSFVTVGTTVPNASGTPNDVGIRWIQVCYFLFGFAMPAAVLLALLVVWLVPLPIGLQRLVFVLAEVFNTWSALEVFCVAIGASLWQLQQFAAFIIGDKCDGINAILVRIDDKLNGDDKCIDVIASLTANCWVIFTAAAFFLAIVIPSLTVIDVAIKERIANARHTFSGGSRLNHQLLLSVAAEDSSKAELSNPLGANLSYDLLADGARPLLADAEASSSSTSNRAADTENECLVARSVHFPVSSTGGLGGDNVMSSFSDSNVEDHQLRSKVLTTWQRIQSWYLSSLFSIGLITVVDPSDVMGLDAIGVGVANTLSQSLRVSHVSTASNGHQIAAGYSPLPRDCDVPEN